LLLFGAVSMGLLITDLLYYGYPLGFPSELIPYISPSIRTNVALCFYFILKSGNYSRLSVFFGGVNFEI